MTPWEPSALRKALRAAMPPEAFEPQPQRGVVAWLQIGAMGGVVWAIVALELPWPADLALSLGLGQMMTSVGLAGHEAIHRSVFRSRLANQVLGAAAFLPLLVTPGVWHAWHVQAHHGNTNLADRDPDALPTLEDYERRWMARMRARMSPGHRHWMSVASLLWMFSLQAQVFLWVHADQPGLRDRLHFDRRRERVLSTLLVGAWLAAGFALGWPNALWVLVLPLATANATLMLYISTQHWFRPLATHDDPITTTVSVEVPWLFDVWHLRFSHHQEHHLFPSMSHRFAPLLREKVRELVPEAVSVLPWRTALRAAFTTPALYADPSTLVHEDGSARTDLPELARGLGIAAPRERA